MIRRIAFLLISLFFISASNAQSIAVSGVVKDSANNKGVPYANLYFNSKTPCVADSSGNFSCRVEKGNYQVEIKADDYKASHLKWNVEPDSYKIIFLKSDEEKLAEVKVMGKRNWDVGLLMQTQGTSIYAGKKNEIVNLEKIQANTATNNSRQIYAKVPGVNIIENDEAGIQLSIATRGLNPNRTTEFNSRQNGYDISADPIGYPETYYTPPADALSNIEIIRGAASLQYGTQFGGLLNFRFKKGNPDKPFELVTKQTAGSYGFFNSFNSIGGQLKNLNYYGFYNYKRGDGWRDNTGFGVHNAYTSLKYALSDKIVLGFEYTFMHYQMQQPGGLTDKAFYENPKQSLRNRNWFEADWNLPAITFDYTIDTNNLLSIKAYALLANRKNVGNINSIIEPDDISMPRTVMNDVYRNYYVEARYMHHYKLFNNNVSSFLAGGRFYHGDTHRMQGYNYTGADADFSIRDPNNMQIDYRFPSYNVAAFAENVFQLTDKFSVTPGMRFEYIQTNGIGYTIPDTTTGSKINGDERHVRNFPLLGVGLEYKISKGTDAYANISQNYSPVNFGDIIIVQPGMKVDPDLKDVKGYNFDIGYRGQYKNLVSFDFSAFYLLYKNRIGTMLQIDGSTDIYQYKTNISDSRSMGTESYADINLLHLLSKYRYSGNKFAFFGSLAYTDAVYINPSNDPQRKRFEGKQVEYAAPWIYRYGIDYLFGKLSGSLQYSYTSAEFSDASNAPSSADGSVGLIPAYHTVDFTTSYAYKKWLLLFSVNNLTDTKYFTRRTTGFPGPGIIPSAGRAYYLTLQFKL